MKSRLLIALALLAMTGTANAAPFYSGETLLDLCGIGSDNSKLVFGLCEGYLTAIADIGQGKVFCIPKRINPRALRPILFLYAATASAAELNKRAPVVVNAF